MFVIHKFHHAICAAIDLGGSKPDQLYQLRFETGLRQMLLEADQTLDGSGIGLMKIETRFHGS